MTQCLVKRDIMKGQNKILITSYIKSVYLIPAKGKTIQETKEDDIYIRRN